MYSSLRARYRSCTIYSPFSGSIFRRKSSGCVRIKYIATARTAHICHRRCNTPFVGCVHPLVQPSVRLLVGPSVTHFHGQPKVSGVSLPAWSSLISFSSISVHFEPIQKNKLSMDGCTDWLINTPYRVVSHD